MAQYTESIISYFDVLGFKALISSDNDPEQVATKLRALRRHSETDEDIARMFGSTFTNFSDLVLRTTPVQQYGKPKGRGTVYWELYDLLHAQAELIRNKVLLRGAVTIGDIYVRDGITFGPGLVRAYELESTVALYPRIIVDPAIFARMSVDPGIRDHSYEEEIGYLRQLLSRGTDGIWFIDYLRAFESEVDHQEDYLRLLMDHRDLISEMLQNVSKVDSIVTKYGWLRNYHNRWVKQLNEDAVRSLGIEKEKLFVRSGAQILPDLSPE